MRMQMEYSLKFSSDTLYFFKIMSHCYDLRGVWNADNYIDP